MAKATVYEKDLVVSDVRRCPDRKGRGCDNCVDGFIPNPTPKVKSKPVIVKNKDKDDD